MNSSAVSNSSAELGFALIRAVYQEEHSSSRFNAVYDTVPSVHTGRNPVLSAVRCERMFVGPQP
jgi:hypothetical protein